MPVSSWAATATALQDQTCAGFRSGSLTCSAGEFTVAPVFSAAPGTPPFCVAGQAFSFLVDLILSGTNADRYNIGFFVGQEGNDPRASTPGNICSVATFPTTPSPWSNLNGDACGDFIARGSLTTTINQIKVVCTGDSTGALVIPYVLTYWQNTGNTCTGPANVTNGAPSKCNAGIAPVSGVVSVYSGTYVDVTKATVPDNAGQSFSLTATGPAGSRVVALVGGTYTPASSSAVNSSVTVTLTTGQTARFFMNALSSNQTLTITEAATAGWNNSAAISCSPVRGAPSITTNNAARSITAVLNSTNSAAACTITNAKTTPTTGTVRFVSDLAGNGDVVQTAAGNMLYIRVDDSDQNYDSATRQTVTATLRASSGDTAVVTLNETDINSGIFTAAIASQQGAAIAADGILQVTPGATVSVEYVDRIDASFNVYQIRTDSLLIQSAKPTISLEKTADQVSVKPGADILYTIYYRNLGDGAASNLIITDSIPRNTTYVAGSMRIGTAASTYGTATILTDAIDADAGQISDGNVLFIVTGVAANDNVANSGTDEGKVYFKVRVN